MAKLRYALIQTGKLYTTIPGSIVTAGRNWQFAYRGLGVDVIESRTVYGHPILQLRRLQEHLSRRGRKFLKNRSHPEP